MSNLNIDALILNRNLRVVTNELVQVLKESNCFRMVGVIDAGSRGEEISEHTVVLENSLEVETLGLRINRGFNLGIEWWVRQENASDYLLLLPNDSEVEALNLTKLTDYIEFFSPIGAIVPLPKESPYREILPNSRVGLGWHFNEGPIILNKDYVKLSRLCGKSVFDSENFRGYLSFIDLALHIYANHFSMIGTDLISFSENESHLQKHYDLIVTENIMRNAELIVKEGRIWLGKKYGFTDAMTLENLTRLAFDDFVKSNPIYSEHVIR